MLCLAVVSALAACESWCSKWTLSQDRCKTCECVSERECMEKVEASPPPPPRIKPAGADKWWGTPWRGGADVPLEPQWGTVPKTPQGEWHNGASALGPVRHAVAGAPEAGWAVDFSNSVSMSKGALRVGGNSRLYLVEDHRKGTWGEHKYVRLDLHEEALRFTLDLSGVPCGCLACVYMVAMPDPDETSSSYCDMAENLAPGLGGGTCTEIDVLEANNNAMQSAIHTRADQKIINSGECDQNGCFARTGGPAAPNWAQQLYGPGKSIDSMKPFDVETRVSDGGELTIKLAQGRNNEHVIFDRRIGGNPQGSGVPANAMRAIRSSMGRLALVASLWKSEDLTWLDGYA